MKNAAGHENSISFSRPFVSFVNSHEFPAMSLYKAIKRPFGLTYYYVKDEVLPVWRQALLRAHARREVNRCSRHMLPGVTLAELIGARRSEEHTSELQSQ